MKTKYLIKSEMEKREMTVIELAEMLKISRSYLNKIINGKRKGLKHRQFICDILGLPGLEMRKE